MAKATVHKKTVVSNITLDLTLNEAETLLDIFWKTGGSTGTLASNPDAFSRRAYTDRISKALNAQGIYRSDDGTLDGRLYFDDIERMED